MKVNFKKGKYLIARLFKALGKLIRVFKTI